MKNSAKEADLKIRKRSKNHGKINYPFKHLSLANLLEKHLDPNNDTKFHDFVESLNKSNSIELKASRVKSKIVLVFLKYQKSIENGPDNQPSQFSNLIVVMLKDKSALQFGEDGAPLGTDIIDFDDLMQAAIINIDDFKSAVIKKDNADVSFINGLGGTTDYFIDFFDAKEVIRNQESVSNVIKAFEDFSASVSLRRALRESCQEKIKLLIDANERKKVATRLCDISLIIYSVLKDEKGSDISRESFSEFVQEYNYKVNEEFTMSKNDRESFEFISFDTDVGALKLKKSLFGKDKRNVVFNEKSNELTIFTQITDPTVIAAIKKIQNE